MEAGVLPTATASAVGLLEGRSASSAPLHARYTASARIFSLLKEATFAPALHSFAHGIIWTTKECALFAT
jgi:hypothetical protein